MHRQWSSRDGRGALLDPGTADRLLTRQLPPDDAPPRYGSVALAFAGVDGEATAPELAPMADVVAAMSAALRMSPLVPRAAKDDASHGGRARRVASLALVAMLVTFGGLTAAGALPAPAQRVVAHVLDTFGVHVPSADDRSGVDDPPVGGTGSEPRSNSVSPPAGQVPATSPTTATVVGASSTLGVPDPAAGTPPFSVPPVSGTVPGEGNANGLGNGAANGNDGNGNGNGNGNAYGHDNATSDPGNSESGHSHNPG
jgi:hypothetical protein